MSRINPKTEPKNFREQSHLNAMAGLSYDITNPITNLRIAAASCFFGEPQYYRRTEGEKPPRHAPAWRLTDNLVKHLNSMLNAVNPLDWRDLSPQQMMERAIDKALDYDPEATLQVAVYLRKVAFIRVTPQVILVRAANHSKVKGTGLIGKYASDILGRVDEAATGLAYQLATYGKPVPNSLKKAWANYLSSVGEYGLAKYRQEDHLVKLVDVVNLVHAKSPAINKLMKNELKLNERTWESLISAKGSNKETWTEALDVMGHMALLRNLRNLLEKGVPSDLFAKKLVEGAPEGKQLPFRYYSAYRAVERIAPPSVLDAIEEALNLSVGNLPKLSGRVISLVDNSGSAQGASTSAMGTMSVATIGNLTGILTGMCADEGYVGVFGDRLHTMSVRKMGSVFDKLKEVERVGDGIGGGTENGIWLFWDKAIRENEHWDKVFIYSDMQAGHGGLYGIDPNAYSAFKWQNGRHIDVPKLIAEYRRKVNPNVLVFLVQIAGQQDTIVPDFFDKTYILGGWNDAVIRFAAEMSDITQQ